MNTDGTIKNAKGKIVDFHVEVYTRPNLRDGTHEMFMFRGRRELDNIFDKKVIDSQTKELYFYHPETFCNIPELQAMIGFIPYFYPNVEKCHIVTHSVYIIQTVKSENIGIYDNPHDFPPTSDPLVHLCKQPNEFEGLYANGIKVN